MYYTYVLRSVSKPSKLYIGWSADLRERIKSHNARQVTATKYGCPWQVVYYEAYETQEQARDRERVLKQRGKAWQALKQRIEHSS